MDLVEINSNLSFRPVISTLIGQCLLLQTKLFSFCCLLHLYSFQNCISFFLMPTFFFSLLCFLLKSILLFDLLLSSSRHGFSLFLHLNLELLLFVLHLFTAFLKFAKFIILFLSSHLLKFSFLLDLSLPELVFLTVDNLLLFISCLIFVELRCVNFVLLLKSKFIRVLNRLISFFDWRCSVDWVRASSRSCLVTTFVFFLFKADYRCRFLLRLSLYLFNLRQSLITSSIFFFTK